MLTPPTVPPPPPTFKISIEPGFSIVVNNTFPRAIRILFNLFKKIFPSEGNLVGTLHTQVLSVYIKSRKKGLFDLSSKQFTYSSPQNPHTGGGGNPLSPIVQRVC